MEDKHILVSLSQVRTASLGETVARSASPLLLPGHRARLEKNSDLQSLRRLAASSTDPLQACRAGRICRLDVLV